MSTNRKRQVTMSDDKWEQTKSFYRKIFAAIDEDVDGYLSDKEFKKFLISCDIQMTAAEFNNIYDRCNDPIRGKLAGKFLFEDFVQFMEEYRAKFRSDQITRMSVYAIDSPLSPDEVAFETVFDEIDMDKNGSISFKELMVFCKKQGLRLGYGEIMAFIKYFDKDGDGELRLEEIKEMVTNNQEMFGPGMAYVPEAPQVCKALPVFGPRPKKSEKERKVRKLRDVRRSILSLLRPKFEMELDPDDIENMRWGLFAGFDRRVGDESVMTGKDFIVQDILPGKYNLQEMVSFRDLPPLKPKYVEISGVSWVSGRDKKSGTIFFPDSFDEYLDVEFATNELLDYYGCSIANTRKDDVVVVDMRHAIQDFTYSEQYLDKYVLAPKSKSGNGGAGIERHDFHHLDCPLDVENGFFVLGKFVDDDESVIHLTAFRIPVRHTLYLPGGTIHSNDYLRGTWRTMLSDVAPIDYAHLHKNGQNFCFKFKSFY